MTNRDDLSPRSGTKSEHPAPVLPRLRPIKLSTLRAIRDEAGRVYREARAGRLGTQEATRLVFILDRLRELTVAIDFEERIALLEGLQDETKTRP